MVVRKKGRKRQFRDERQADLFEHIDQLLPGTAKPSLVEVPEQPRTDDGELNCDQLVRRLVNEAIDATDISREQLCERLTRLVGRTISVATLNSFTGASRPNRMPADLLPALTIILGPHIMDGIAAAAGYRLLNREDAALARCTQLQLLINKITDELEATAAQISLKATRRAGHG